MMGLVQRALGDAWDALPPALKAHHRSGTTLEVGHLDIAFPAGMRPVLCALAPLGALVRRRGQAVATRVEKAMVGGRQHWRRTLRYADGQVLRFDSVWAPQPEGQLIEFVNPWLGLQMRAFVDGAQLHFQGVCFIVKLGPWRLRVPEALVLGHTTIVETALDAHRFAMDFRMVHPVFGELFRYSGVFRADAVAGT